VDAVLRIPALANQMQPEAGELVLAAIVGSDSQTADTKSRHDNAASTRASMSRKNRAPGIDSITPRTGPRPALPAARGH
jgi:hypothetical protein